jgi:hypothetical protein
MAPLIPLAVMIAQEFAPQIIGLFKGKRRTQNPPIARS